MFQVQWYTNVCLLEHSLLHPATITTKRAPPLELVRPFWGAVAWSGAGAGGRQSAHTSRLGYKSSSSIVE